MRYQRPGPTPRLNIMNARFNDPEYQILIEAAALSEMAVTAFLGHAALEYAKRLIKKHEKQKDLK